ncbi:MAG: hypothetical protein R6T85_06780 [Egibacteraceae bacterium]
MSDEPLAALRGEAEAVAALLAEVPDEDWARTVHGGWRLDALAGHLAAVLTAVAAPATAVPPRADLDRLALVRAGPALPGSGPAPPAPPEPAEAVAEASRRLAGLDATTVVASDLGAVARGERAAAATLPLVIGHLDAAAALERPPVATPAAGRVAARICEALLEGPRPRAMGRARLLKAATGRLDVADARFPLLG